MACEAQKSLDWQPKMYGEEPQVPSLMSRVIPSTLNYRRNINADPMLDETSSGLKTPRLRIIKKKQTNRPLVFSTGS